MWPVPELSAIVHYFEWRPATKMALTGSRKFEALGLDRKHWSNAGRIRTIFEDEFAACGRPYCNPHSLRNTIVLLDESPCKSREELRASSENLGMTAR